MALRQICLCKTRGYLIDKFKNKSTVKWYITSSFCITFTSNVPKHISTERESQIQHLHTFYIAQDIYKYFLNLCEKLPSISFVFFNSSILSFSFSGNTKTSTQSKVKQYFEFAWINTFIRSSVNAFVSSLDGIMLLHFSSRNAMQTLLKIKHFVR